MTDKTLQERLRERAGEDGYYDFYIECADALDAQAERIKDLEDTERAYEELSQYLVGDKMIAPIAGVIALETRIKALEGALREMIELADFAMLEANRDGGEFDRKADLAEARALLGEK